MQCYSSSEDEDNMEEYGGTQMELSRDFSFFSDKTVDESTLWKLQ